MTYKIKPEYLDLWEGGDTPTNPDRIITEDELEMIVRGWEITKEDVIHQLIPLDSLV